MPRRVELDHFILHLDAAIRDKPGQRGILDEVKSHIVNAPTNARSLRSFLTPLFQASANRSVRDLVLSAETHGWGVLELMEYIDGRQLG